MMDYIEQATRLRKSARRNRTISKVMFAVAALFVVAGTVLIIMSGQPGSAIAIMSGLTIAISGFSVQSSAAMALGSAERYERLARGRR